MISVIIPTYNRKKYLQRAIDSVVAQSRQPDELLIIDDGSTDDTAALVEQYASNTPFPLRYFYQENMGAAAARNLGISRAQGDVLCFLDSDDWWVKKKLALQEKALLAHSNVLITHSREIWYRNGVRVNQKKKHAPGNGHIFSACLKMCVVGMSTVMARKELFARYGLFNASLPCCEDYDLWLRVACEHPFYLLDQALTEKEGGRDDQLSVIYRMGMDKYRIRSLCDLLQGSNLTAEQYRETVKELERKCRIYGQGCLKHGRKEEGQRFLALAERYTTPLHTGTTQINQHGWTKLASHNQQ